MNRLRGFKLGAVCLTLLTTLSPSWSAPAPAGKSGLDQVPATAPIVIHLRGVEGTRDRLVAMMENALPDVLKLFQPQMDDAIKNGINGRKLRGLVKNGPIFLVFTELPKPQENPPKMAIIAAVSNYKDFRDNLLTEAERKAIKTNGGVEKVIVENNEPVYFVDRKGFAIVSPHEEVAASFTKKLPQGIDGKLSKEQAAKLLSSDIGVYVSMDTLNKEYAEQIKGARQSIEQLMNLAGGQVGDSQKNALELAKKAIGPIFQSIEDSQGLLLTFEFRPGGLAFHVQSELRNGSATAKLLDDAKPVAFQDLARMPRGSSYYTALKTGSALNKALGGLIFGVMENKDSKEAKEVAAALEEMIKAKPEIRFDATSLPPTGLQVITYEEPAKAVAAQLKLYKALGVGGGIQSGVLKEKPVIKTAAEKYGDFELNSVKLVWDLEKMADAAAAGQGDDAKKQIAEGLKSLMGEKLNLWFGSDGKAVVQVSAPDWPAAKKILDRYFKKTQTIGDVKGFRDVRKEMPAEASFLGLIDAVQYLGAVANFAKPLLGPFGGQLPPGWPIIPAQPTGSFMGLSVTLQPRRGSFDTFISAAAAQEFYKAFVKPFMPG
jgi:hypothetical protein